MAIRSLVEVSLGMYEHERTTHASIAGFRGGDPAPMILKFQHYFVLNIHWDAEWDNLQQLYTDAHPFGAIFAGADLDGYQLVAVPTRAIDQLYTLED